MIFDFIHETKNVKNIKYTDLNNKDAHDYLQSDKDYKKYYEKIKDDYDGEIAIDAKTNELVGYVFIKNKKSGEEGFISPLFVVKKYRGLGIGKILLNHAINKYNAVDLVVDKDNTIAFNMYKKHGFVIIGDGNNKDQYWMKLKSKLSKDDTVITETKRSELPDSAFGVPEDRKYELDTREHVISAIKLFGHAEESKKKSLAKRIKIAADRYNIEIKPTTQVYKYLNESYINENKKYEDIYDAIINGLIKYDQNPKVGKKDEKLFKNTGKSSDVDFGNKLCICNLKGDYYKICQKLNKELKPLGARLSPDNYGTAFVHLNEQTQTERFYEVLKKKLEEDNNDEYINESNNKSHFYFYHMVPKGTNIKNGITSLRYQYDNNQIDIANKGADKYRDRLVNGWGIYPNRNPEDLSLDEIINGLDKFRGDGGSAQIYFFKYPPYKELGNKMKEILKYKDIYRIDLDDPKVKNIIEYIDWGYYFSNTDNEPMNEEYYRNVTVDQYFSEYTENTNAPLFASIPHIGIKFKNNYIPKNLITKINDSSIINYLNESFINESNNKINLYFISENRNLKKLNPRIPSNFLTKNGYEDAKTKRICFSTDIGKCLTALSMNCTGKEYYVYIPNPSKDYKIINPTIKQVPDVKITDEKWIIEPVDLICIGRIRCTGDAGSVGMKYKYGNNTAELYEWNFEWIEKYKEYYINESFVRVDIDRSELTEEMLIDAANECAHYTRWCKMDDSSFCCVNELNSFSVNVNDATFCFATFNGDEELLSRVLKCCNENNSSRYGKFEVFAKENEHGVWLCGRMTELYTYKEVNESYITEALDGTITETSMRSKFNDSFEEKGNIKLSSFNKVTIDKRFIDNYKAKFKLLRHVDLNDDERIAFLDKDNNLVGYIITNKEKDGLIWITALEVSNQYKGYGLGKQLLDYGVKHLGAQALGVAHDNEVAIKMYEKYGFKISKESIDEVKRKENLNYRMYIGSAVNEAEQLEVPDNYNNDTQSVVELLDNTDPKRIFLSSDWHFYSLKYKKEKNAVNTRDIVSWCKNNIKDEDVFMYLGDMCFRWASDEDNNKVQEIFKSLPGIKILILGNHDIVAGEDFYLNCGFDYVLDELVWHDCIFSHRPININNNKGININIHGHIHKWSEYNTTDGSKNVNVYPYYYDNKPVTLDYLLNNYEELIKKHGNKRSNWVGMGEASYAFGDTRLDLDGINWWYVCLNNRPSCIDEELYYKTLEDAIKAYIKPEYFEKSDKITAYVYTCNGDRIDYDDNALKLIPMGKIWVDKDYNYDWTYTYPLDVIDGKIIPVTNNEYFIKESSCMIEDLLNCVNEYSAASYNPIIPTAKPHLVQLSMDNSVFSGTKFAFSQDIVSNKYMIVNGDCKLEIVDASELANTKCKIYEFVGNKFNINKIEEAYKNDCTVDQAFLYTALSNKNLVTKDQIDFDDDFVPVDIELIKEKRESEKATIKEQWKCINGEQLITFPVLESAIIKNPLKGELARYNDNIHLMESVDGYYLMNDLNNKRTKCVSSLDYITTAMIKSIY